MSTDLITVHKDDRFELIKATFKKHPFHHLPVLGNNKQLVGMISRLDLQNAYELMFYRSVDGSWTREELNNLLAEDIMTPNPKFLTSEDTINNATDLFLYNQFHSLPILNKNDELVGIVTVHDLLAHYFEYPEF